jgi:hypothetical protein
MQTALPLLWALVFLFMPSTSSALDEVLVYKTKTTIKRMMSTGTETRVLTGYLVCYRNQDGWHVASLDLFTVLTNKFMESNFFDDAYVGFVSNSLARLTLFPSPDYVVLDSTGKTNAINGDCSFSLSGKVQSLTNRVTHQSILMPRVFSGSTTIDLFDINAPFPDGLPFDVLLSSTTIEKMTATYSQSITEALQRSSDGGADAEAYLEAQREQLLQDGYTTRSRYY